MVRNVNQPVKADRSEPFYRGATTQQQKAGHPKKIFKKYNIKEAANNTNGVSFHVPMFGVGSEWDSGIT